MKSHKALTRAARKIFPDFRSVPGKSGAVSYLLKLGTPKESRKAQYLKLRTTCCQQTSYQTRFWFVFFFFVIVVIVVVLLLLLLLPLVHVVVVVAIVVSVLLSSMTLSHKNKSPLACIVCWHHSFSSLILVSPSAASTTMNGRQQWAYACSPQYRQADIKTYYIMTCRPKASTV